MALSTEGELGSIPERRRRLEALRQRIYALEERLSPLKEEEKRRIRELHDLVVEGTPINNISDDILREIFLQTLPSARQQALSTYPRPFRIWEAPLLLRQVCKRWKGVAENYTLLWTTLRVYIAEKAPDDAPSHRDMVLHWAAAWRRLTKASNIELHLITHVNTTGLLSAALPPPSYERITKLSLAGELVEFLPITMLTPERGFPVLEELIIYNQDELSTEGWRERGPIEAFANCPRLRRVAIGCVSSEDYFPIIVLPWRQLTHLIIIYPAPLQFYAEFMKHCRSLRFACIVPGNDPLDQSDEFHTCDWRWDSLSSLTLNFWESEQHLPFFPAHFRHVQLGALESLRLIGPEYYADDPELLHAIRSMKLLRHLSLCFSAIGTIAYVETFQYLPQLMSLDIQLRSVWDDELDVLQILNGRPALLPNLTSITLDIGPGWARKFSLEDLVALIEARSRKKLQDVKVYIPVDLKSAKGAFSLDLDDFYKLEDNSYGVKVEIQDVYTERRNMEDLTYWVDRDPELVYVWPEARNAFVLRDNDPDGYLVGDSDDSGED